MANDKFYGYSPSPKKGSIGVHYGNDNRLDRVNPYEFKKGMDYELATMGISRLNESTPDQRQTSTDKVLKNLATFPAYYSCKIQYETEFRNFQGRKPSFNKYLKEKYENKMKPVDQTYKNDKMVALKEAIKNEKGVKKGLKKWHFKAENVRDFGWSSSRKFIWDAMVVRQPSKDVLAMSFYPKEGNPLWEQYSTKTVAHTLKSYSKFTFDYPYPVAISVHTKWIGMEYPMICFNGGRPEADGTYSKRTKYGMIGVIIHEVGHNYFPMIINSDERQWTWMDEGLNTFLQYLTEQEFEKGYPSRRGPAYKIVNYMKGDKNRISPIMTNSESIHQFGNNAYGKPATAMNILRETIMGRELFDYAFKIYSNRWMFKHPNPEDLFRSLEDASSIDLDWFWRGWFYTTDYNDIALKEVKKFYLTDQPTEKAKKMAKRYSMDLADYEGKLVYFKEEQKGEVNTSLIASEIPLIKDHIASMSDKEKSLLKEIPNYFYEVTFEKPGGLVMPIIVELEYKDGTKERHNFPAQIWRYNDKEVSKVFKTTKEIKKITIDPDLETADIDTSNNSWPKKTSNRFDSFKNKLKG